MRPAPHVRAPATSTPTEPPEVPIAMVPKSRSLVFVTVTGAKIVAEALALAVAACAEVAETPSDATTAAIANLTEFFMSQFPLGHTLK
jgi:hypothetical protein